MKIPKKHIPGMAVLTLWLYTNEDWMVKSALEMLGKDAELYGEPNDAGDGSHWLPFEPLNEGEGVEAVIEAELGELVPAFYYVDEWDANDAFKKRNLVTLEYFVETTGYELEDLEDPITLRRVFCEVCKMNDDSGMCGGVMAWAAYENAIVIVYTDLYLSAL